MPRALLLLCLAVAACAVATPNATAPHPTVNISFIKEVTLSVAPQDIALTPQAEQEVSSFLESALKLIDPIMRFFSGLGSSWSAPSEQDIIHA
jgi:hypothetical protein